ncbi:MAG: hypothetical protein K0R99_3002 [Microbacterium sp.]|jgi:hypothetical protein|uniref:hypothetical protein n=1 Tax=Microbacterium sp. TaxID=51671 RepID=UPI002635BC7D|nr:hypothetical protein [Microbacterium sp.]MDF2561556.1 hypothetical protein [Microbacterium sp.]
MAQSDTHAERITELDDLLRTENLSEVFITPTDDGFYGWYARALSTLAVLTVGEQLQYASARADDAGTAQMVVFTNLRFVVVDVKDVTSHHERPVARTVPRSALRGIAVAAGMRHDVKGSASAGWPGELELELTFDGLTAPIAIRGNSYDRFTEDHVASIWKLLDLLRSDLSS